MTDPLLTPEMLEKLKPPPPHVGPLPVREPNLPKPKKALPKRNEKRLAARRELTFGVQAETCRKRPCSVQGCRNRPSVPHHVLSRGAGGRDEHCVPLCWEHHDRAHNGEDLGVDLHLVAQELAADLAARPAHNCEDHAVLRENVCALRSEYVCARCHYVLPDEQEAP